jgi:inorganic triphosphatase YgiF
VKLGGLSAGGLHIRQEWNRHMEEGVFLLEAFSDLPIGKKLMEIVMENPLEELVRTRFRRTTRKLADDRGGVIELAVDEGEIIAGEKRLPLCELELELMEGETVSLIRLGKELAERFPLMFENQSKYERALILAGMQSGKTEDEPPAPAAGDWPSKEALDQILIRKLQEIIGRQELFLENPEDPESAHALRVHIRQTRALLSFSKSLLADENYASLQAKLRELANRLSSIREIDVMLEKWIPIYQEHPGLFQEESKLTGILRRRRREEAEQAVRYFSSGAATPVLLDVWAGFLDMCWEEDADRPIKDFAGKRIGDWTSKFIGGLKALDFGNLKETHALRILGKKIRYAQSEVLPKRDGGSHFDPDALKSLQTFLGEICDAGRNREILQEITEGRTDKQLLFESGILIGHQMHETEKLISAIGKTVKKAGPAD